MTRTLLIDIEIEGNPVPKERPRVEHFQRVDGNGGLRNVTRTKTAAKTAAAESRIAWEVKAALVGHGEPDDAAYAIECHFYESRPNGNHADGDNCLKTICDALNGIVYLDDAQVVEHHAYTYRDQRRPRTQIRIWKLEDGR